MNDLRELRAKYIAHASSWGEATNTGDDRTANKQNIALVKIGKKLEKHSELARNLLIPLLTHSDPGVRLFASIQALNLGIEIDEAEATLIAIANDEDIHLIQLMAQISLLEWKKNRGATTQSKRPSSD